MRLNIVVPLLLGALSVLAGCAPPVPDDSSTRERDTASQKDTETGESDASQSSTSSSSSPTGSSTSDASTCAATQLYCGGKCVDPQVDDANCGACGRSCVCSKGACPGQLRVRAFIDGKAQLAFSGTKVWWHSIDGAAPGLWAGNDAPTLLNGVSWKPIWPRSGENHNCNCDSQPSPNLPQGLAALTQVATVQKIEGRGTVAITEQPSAANGFALKVELNDPASGASWYEIELGFSAE